MKWRKWNIIIHRDLGYLCFGLTLIYGVLHIILSVDTMIFGYTLIMDKKMFFLIQNYMV